MNDEFWMQKRNCDKLERYSAIFLLLMCVLKVEVRSTSQVFKRIV